MPVREKPAPRSIAVALGLLASAGLVGCGSGRVAAGSPAGTAKRPARLVVFMRKSEGGTFQIFQTVSIRSDGTGEVGYYIGESAGVRYTTFTLDPRRLAQLERRVASAEQLPRRVYVGAPPSQIEYAISTPRRFIYTTWEHVPRQLDGLVNALSALIGRHAQAASASAQDAP